MNWGTSARAAIACTTFDQVQIEMGWALFWFDQDKNNGPRPSQLAAVHEIRNIELLSWGREDDLPRLPILGVLRPNMDEPRSQLDVLGRQGAELLPAERTVVGEREHTAIPDRLEPHGTHNGVPLLLVGNPGLFLIAWEQATLACTAKAMGGGVAPTADGVSGADRLLHEVVVIQAQYAQAPLHGGITQTGTRMAVVGVRMLGTWALTEVTHVPRDIALVGHFRIQAEAATHGEIVVQIPTVRIHGVGRAAQIGLNLEPGARRW